MPKKFASRHSEGALTRPQSSEGSRLVRKFLRQTTARAIRPHKAKVRRGVTFDVQILHRATATAIQHTQRQRVDFDAKKHHYHHHRFVVHRARKATKQRSCPVRRLARPASCAKPAGRREDAASAQAGQPPTQTPTLLLKTKGCDSQSLQLGGQPRLKGLRQLGYRPTPPSIAQQVLQFPRRRVLQFEWCHCQFPCRTHARQPFSELALHPKSSKPREPSFREPAIEMRARISQKKTA